MSDTTNKNQDQDPAEEPVNYLAEGPGEQVEDPNALEDLDKLLTEEDPEFLQQIADITIDPAEVNLAIMNESMGSINPAKLSGRTWKFHLKNLFTYGEEPKKFILFWILIVSSVLVVNYGFKFSEKYISKSLFLTSYAEWGGEIKNFNPETEVESFFDNPSFAKNLMTMTKMVTNIRASENSGPNPMLAIEINVEGMSSEAIIEIKDREAEFKDILLRITEEFSYDEVNDVDGKKNNVGAVSYRFKRELNSRPSSPRTS